MPRFDYQRFLREALRQVVRYALLEVAEEGLVGGHHFYLTFHTDAPGVEIPPMLRDLYPERMTIILQHQYWDLVVEDDAFAVTLAFSGVRQRVVVPFAALESFADPEAEFGLRFDAAEAEEATTEEEATAEGGELETESPAGDGEAPAAPGRIVQLDEFRKR